MDEINKKIDFENKFDQEIIEIAAVTGLAGVSFKKDEKENIWNASIKVIAWKNIDKNEPILKKRLKLEWLIFENELEKQKNILKRNQIVRLHVRMGKNSMMLIRVLSSVYKDNDLELVLEESLKPVFYKDELLGKFRLNKEIKFFKKEIKWLSEKGKLYFKLHKDKDIMDSALQTAYFLLKNQVEWDAKIKIFASENLLKMANDYLKNNDKLKINEITRENFINFLKFKIAIVYPKGNFEIFFDNSNMFWSRYIIVKGNIDEGLVLTEVSE